MTPSAFKRILFALVAVFFMTGCAATGVLQEADERAATGQWEEAVLKYGEAAQKDPDNLDYRSKYARARFEAAEVHFKRGEVHLSGGSHEAAILEFQAALLLNPGLDKAQASLKKARRLMDSVYYYGKGIELLNESRAREARAAFRKAVSLDPKNESASAELDRMKRNERVVMDGRELDLKSSEPITLEFKDASIKKVFEVISRLSGINFVFDEDVKDSRTTLFLKNASFQQALELTLLTNKLSRKIVSENTIVIYPSTPQKAQQYEDMMIRVFYLNNSDAKKTVNLLKTMIKARDIQVHEDLNAIVVRARPEAIELAEKILEATDLADSEVMLAVEIVEINRSKAENLGLDLSPDSITASILGSSESGTTLADVKGLSSGMVLLGLPSAILNLKQEDIDANILANPRIRVKNNSKAKIHIGDKVPIITTTVNQGVSTENIQYQDVGLKLNVEPTIRQDDEVDLKLGLEVSSIGAKTTTTSGSVAYQIGTRNAETVLRLKDGETQIIGGLINEEDKTTVSKVPLLSEVPLLGALFTNTDGGRVKTDILLSITPYIVRRLEVPYETSEGFFSGRDEYPAPRPLIEERAGPADTETPLPPPYQTPPQPPGSAPPLP